MALHHAIKLKSLICVLTNINYNRWMIYGGSHQGPNLIDMNGALDTAHRYLIGCRILGKYLKSIENALLILNKWQNKRVPKI